MHTIIERFGSVVKGIINGFDRIVFKGIIRPICYADGAMQFLGRRGILNKHYKAWMDQQSKAIVREVDCYAQEQTGRPITHWQSWKVDKDKTAKQRQQDEQVTSGLIGVWSCQETGRSFRASYDKAKGFPQLRSYNQFCKHLYLYFDHQRYGFMNVRLQTWFPYHIQVCLNGRQWLKRQLEREGLGHILHNGNKFLHIDDYALAQVLLDRQLDVRWDTLLNSFLAEAFPTMRAALGDHLGYYWTQWQSEWATDIIFDTPDSIRPVMDDLLKHAFVTGTAERVLRYLDRPLTQAGQPYLSLSDDVISRLNRFAEGMRVRHWAGGNSVKLYNERNILRAEATINDPTKFNVYRRKTGQSQRAKKQLRPLRKGTADIAMRAKVSQDINNRYLNGIAAFNDDTRLKDLISPHTKARTSNGRRIRGLCPLGKDRELLEALCDPVFSVSHISNKSLRERLKHTDWGKGRTDKQLSARISRHLKLLRDHGLIRKVKQCRQYMLTVKGHQLTTCLTAALSSSTQKLMKDAA